MRYIKEGMTNSIWVIEWTMPVIHSRSKLVGITSTFFEQYVTWRDMGEWRSWMANRWDEWYSKWDHRLKRPILTRNSEPQYPRAWYSTHKCHPIFWDCNLVSHLAMGLQDVFKWRTLRHRGCLVLHKIPRILFREIGRLKDGWQLRTWRDMSGAKAASSSDLWKMQGTSGPQKDQCLANPTKFIWSTAPFKKERFKKNHPVSSLYTTHSRYQLSLEISRNYPPCCT